MWSTAAARSWNTMRADLIDVLQAGIAGALDKRAGEAVARAKKELRGV